MKFTAIMKEWRQGNKADQDRRAGQNDSRKLDPRVYPNRSINPDPDRSINLDPDPRARRLSRDAKRVRDAEKVSE
jgi:hypothetical protein